MELSSAEHLAEPKRAEDNSAKLKKTFLQLYGNLNGDKVISGFVKTNLQTIDDRFWLANANLQSCRTGDVNDRDTLWDANCNCCRAAIELVGRVKSVSRGSRRL